MGVISKWNRKLPLWYKRCKNVGFAWYDCMLEQIKYNYSRGKDACIHSRYITSWNNSKQMSALLDMSDMCCFSLKASAFHFVTMFPVLNKNVQAVLKFTCWSLHRTTSLQVIIKIYMWNFSVGLQAQPWKSILSGRMACRVVVSGEEVTLVISKGGKILHTIFTQIQDENFFLIRHLKMGRVVL
jgi:hypothetical protein